MFYGEAEAPKRFNTSSLSRKGLQRNNGVVLYWYDQRIYDFTGSCLGNQSCDHVIMLKDLFLITRSVKSLIEFSQNFIPSQRNQIIRGRDNAGDNKQQQAEPHKTIQRLLLCHINISDQSIESQSIMLAPEEENEAEVRREDQDNINKFARLNARLHEVRNERELLKVRGYYYIGMLC